MKAKLPMDGRVLALAGAAGAALFLAVGPGAELRRSLTRRFLGGRTDHRLGERVEYTWEPADHRNGAEARHTLTHERPDHALADRPTGERRLTERMVGDVPAPMNTAATVERPLPGTAGSRHERGENPTGHAPTNAPLSATAPVATTASQETRRRGGPLTLRFPTDRRVGTVYASELPEKATLGYAWEQIADARGEVIIPAGRHARLDVEDEAAGDLGWLSGVGDGIHTLNLPKDPVRDAQLAHLANLGSLRHLDLSDTPVTDAGLAHLAGLTGLEHLNLSNTAVTDAGLAHLAGMHNLETLHLWGTHVTDAGLGALGGLPKLRELSLGETAITDAGLRHLHGLGHLETLDLSATRVTDSGLAELKKLRDIRDLKLLGTKITAAGSRHLEEQLSNSSVVHEAR